MVGQGKTMDLSHTSSCADNFTDRLAMLGQIGTDSLQTGKADLCDSLFLMTP